MTNDQFAVSLAMVNECAVVVMETAQPGDGCAHLAHAARARLAEFNALAMLSAKRQYPFDKRLQPLVRAIDDFVADIEKQISKPIEVDGEEEILAALDQRAEATEWLDSARIAGCGLLVHLTKSLAALQTSG